ncbi:hypothetical protein ES703_110613 [subsurface metagenome]
MDDKYSVFTLPVLDHQCAVRDEITLPKSAGLEPQEHFHLGVQHVIHLEYAGYHAAGIGQDQTAVVNRGVSLEGMPLGRIVGRRR